MSVPTHPQTSRLCRSVDIYYIAQAAGYGRRNPGWIVAWVQTLHARHALPAPIGAHGENAAPISLSSRWHRIEIDPWLAGGFPPLAALAPSQRAATTPLPVNAPDFGPGAAA